MAPDNAAGSVPSTTQSTCSDIGDGAAEYPDVDAAGEQRRPGHCSSAPSTTAFPAGAGGFERVFHHVDADGDGRISPAELCACMLGFGEELSLEDAEALVASADSDGDGLLELEDFAKLAAAEGEEERESDLRAAFGVYEMEGLGFITPGSLCSALGRVTGASVMVDVEECKAMICRFDLDGDGVISFDEFRVMMAC